MIRDNTMTVARICAEKWPRILTVTMAGAYICEAPAAFRKSPFAHLIRHSWSGREFVDREELDRAFTEWVDQHPEESIREAGNHGPDGGAQ